MSWFYTNLVGLLLLIGFSGVVSFVLILFSFLFGPSVPEVEKVSAYECGFDPYEDARNTFDVRFYLVAIFFIIFDLETAFFFPWSITFSLLNINGIWAMFDFLLELLVGYVYVWQIGALEWS